MSKPRYTKGDVFGGYLSGRRVVVVLVEPFEVDGSWAWTVEGAGLGDTTSVEERTIFNEYERLVPEEFES